MPLIFDDCRIDTDRYEVSRGGKLCKVEPKVFDLLVYLARHPQQLFSHQQLIDAVWAGRVVSDSTVSTCVKNARKALGDSGETQRYIETVRGRGFRFKAEVREAAESNAAEAADNQTSSPPQKRPEPESAATAAALPALLIKPLRVLSNDDQTDRLASSLVADLARILTRIPLLRIRQLPEPADTGAAASIGASPRELHEAHGVDFVLDGTLQPLARTYRATVQLLDARSGFQLWSDQINVYGPLDQAVDAAPVAIIARLEPRLHKAIHDSVQAAGPQLGSRQLFLEAASVMVLNGWGHAGFSQAAQLLRRSCELEPDFALAHAFLSLVTGFGDRVGLMGDREQAKAEAQRAAEQALSLDSMDATVLGYAGCALADIGQRDRALPILESAVEISPANAQAWVALGSVQVLDGRTEAGIRDLSHGIAISPLDSRLSVWGAILTMGLIQAERLDEALQQGQLACRRDHRCYLPRVALAGAHLLREQRDQATVAMREAYRLKPDLSPRQIESIAGRGLSVGLRRLHRPRR